MFIVARLTMRSCPISYNLNASRMLNWKFNVLHNIKVINTQAQLAHKQHMNFLGISLCLI
jgi:hypothetical protein